MLIYTEEPQHYGHLLKNTLVHIWQAKQLHFNLLWIPKIFGILPKTECAKCPNSSHENPGWIMDKYFSVLSYCTMTSKSALWDWGRICYDLYQKITSINLYQGICSWDRAIVKVLNNAAYSATYSSIYSKTQSELIHINV